MQYAKSDNTSRLKAYKGGRAACEICGTTVIAKCGDLNIWHWAHEKKCVDGWQYEPTTEWHLSWQAHFEESEREVVVHKEGIIHRADILTKKQVVIEIQNSPITVEEIGKREEFYQKMIWVINSEKFVHNLSFSPYLTLTPTNLWLHPKFTLRGCEVSFEVPRDDDGMIVETLKREGFIQKSQRVWQRF